MVELSSVSKTYFDSDRVLDHVSLQVKKGEFLYVVGGSGAGKSSLLRILATEEAISQGTLKLFGYDMASVSASTRTRIRRAIGYIPQGLHLLPDFTVQENVELSLQLSHRKVFKAADLLERLGLAEQRHRKVALLSGGERQRVAVARALIRAPELLIADEPTGAQDKDSTWNVMDLFMRANVSGTAVIVATHDREIVRRVRKRCVILRSGRVFQEENV